MGRKPGRAGKYVYLCFALLILFAACSLLPEPRRQREMRDLYASGNSLLAQGNYDAALKTFEKLLHMAQGEPPSDAATYGIGLVHAHPRNPLRDRQKAVASFSQVIGSFPASPWAEPARIWVEVLREAETSRLEAEKAERWLEQSKREMEKTRMLLEATRLEVEKTRAELEKSRQEIEKSKQILEKSRQLDIEIEQKRRQRRK